MSSQCKIWTLGVSKPLSKTIGIMPLNKSMTYVLTHYPKVGLYLANRCRLKDRSHEEVAHCRWMLKNQAFMNKNFPRGTCALVDYEGDKYHAWIIGFENGKVHVRWCNEDFTHRVSDSDDDYDKGIYCDDACVSFSKVFFLKEKGVNIDFEEKEFDQASSSSDDVEEVNRNFCSRSSRKRNYDDMDDFIVDDDEDDDEFFDKESDEESYEQDSDEQDDDEVEIVSNSEKDMENDKVEKLWRLYQTGRITKNLYEDYMRRVLDKMVDGK